MKYDAGVLDQLLAVKLHNVSETEPEVSPPLSSIAAVQALDLDSTKFDAIDSWRAFIIGWNFAIAAIAAALTAPAGDGSELSPAIENALHDLDQARETTSDERRLEERVANDRRAVAADQAASPTSIALMAEGQRVDWCAEPVCGIDREIRRAALAGWLAEPMPKPLGRATNMLMLAEQKGKSLAADAQWFVAQVNDAVAQTNRRLARADRRARVSGSGKGKKRSAAA